MKKLTIEQWLELKEKSIEYRVLYPYLREGQILFNFLCDINPELAESVRGTPVDPFFITDMRSKKGTDFIMAIIDDEALEILKMNLF